MKVNERCLIHIAQSDDNPIDHSGWLYQLNTNNNGNNNNDNDRKSSSTKRWFVLKENLLFYYNNKNDKEPHGCIILDGYRVEIIENFTEDYFPFKIDFGLNKFGSQLKSYILGAESHLEMEKWIKALSCASYDYLKMVVSELQHRLEQSKSSSLSIESNNNKDECDNPIVDDTTTTTTTTNSSTKPETNNVKLNCDTTRFNPFDLDNGTDQYTEDITFWDLHDKYGKDIRKYYLKNQQPDENHVIENHHKFESDSD